MAKLAVGVTELTEAVRALGVEPNNVYRIGIVLQGGSPPVIVVQQYNDPSVVANLIDQIAKGDFSLLMNSNRKADSNG